MITRAGSASGVEPPETAILAARQFTSRDAKFTVTPVTEGAWHSFYAAESDQFTGFVDAYTGAVFYGAYDLPAEPKSVISKEDAATIARGFADEHGISTNGLTASVESASHGVVSLFDVSMRRLEGEVAVPDFREFQVATDGSVVSFSDEQLPYTVPKDYLSKADALAVARDLPGVGNADLQRADIHIAFDHPGHQVLEWEFAFQSLDDVGAIEATLVDVDALTGKASVAGRG